jgi:2-octaprenyl-6-methoxyphenol hydroxylase
MPDRPFSRPRNMPASDIMIVGGGAVGLTAAIAAAKAGLTVRLIAGPAPRRDGRTVALFDSSIAFLDSLGLWQPLSAQTAPLEKLASVDDTGNLFRPPPVTFSSFEIGLDAFGHNIEVSRLVDGLVDAAGSQSGLDLVAGLVETVTVDGLGGEAQLADGRCFRAKLIVGAEGRRSCVRQAAGIKAREWSYPQAALTAIFEHARPHRETSTEFHTRQGPFTLVPLPGNRSSLVWVTDPAKADALHAMDDTALCLAVERQAHSMLGKMKVSGPRGIVPMAGLSVDRFTAPGAALIGEAAHVFPPIGAQGLNLGLRDAAALVEALTDHAAWDDALAAYERSRTVDVRLRTAAIDGFGRSLLSGLLPVDFARGAGLMALALIGPLRRAVMREGITPRLGSPRAMKRMAI